MPKKGAPRYDFLRQLLKGMTSPSPAAAKFDPVWDLLHAAKEQGLPGVHLSSLFGVFHTRGKIWVLRIGQWVCDGVALGHHPWEIFAGVHAWPSSCVM